MSKESFTIDGPNDDLSFLQSRISTFFRKVFYHLHENIPDKYKDKALAYAINVVKQIINNKLKNLELEKLIKKIQRNKVLYEALNELNNSLNGTNGLINNELQKRAQIFRGVVVEDDVTYKFVQKYSKIHLEEIFENKIYINLKYIV